MHKGIIMLVKAEDKSDAISEVRSFLEDYEGQVWDWYVIGGRWNKMLHPLFKKFSDKIKKAHKYYEKIKQEMDNEAWTKEHQSIWKLIGGDGNNPFSDEAPYNTDENDNVCLATECKKTIKEWEIDMDSEAEKHYLKLLEEREKEMEAKKKEKDIWPMSAYYASLYSKCKNDEFSSESNIYDITNFTNKMPSDLDGYYAVMIDTHN